MSVFWSNDNKHNLICNTVWSLTNNISVASDCICVHTYHSIVFYMNDYNKSNHTESYPKSITVTKYIITPFYFSHISCQSLYYQFVIKWLKHLINGHPKYNISNQFRFGDNLQFARMLRFNSLHQKSFVNVKYIQINKLYTNTTDTYHLQPNIIEVEYSNRKQSLPRLFGLGLVCSYSITTILTF